MVDEFVARIERVSHRYGSAVALNDVTIDIPAGRMVGLIGPDGVGKSTLLGLIAGASPICRKALAAICTQPSASSRISTSTPGCSGRGRTSAAAASANC